MTRRFHLMASACIPSRMVPEPSREWSDGPLDPIEALKNIIHEITVDNSLFVDGMHRQIAVTKEALCRIAKFVKEAACPDLP